ncbi:hypothetical protein LTR78_002828 [Recurvomyces mirabilis]|uniref:Adenylate kinase n=1 Tax=Recurvomyces mirabilis TaxID=574656 RepID=A0AAE1C457_9PEZI|nr:hypothetical protein LTR78_002828 [Recurvomyces mirabilis]KAK5159439.1 hypothetical protein LTS14_002581 [Recurvomyces mirabilis]
MALEDTVSKLDILVIGILGGPGSGKGTQCARLEQKYLLKHISIGDVMRAEMEREDSPYASIIKDNMLAGRVGPKELTVGIVKQHIEEAIRKGVCTFVLDGFPRSLDQCEYFENQIAPVRQIIVLDCPEEVLAQRLGSRGRFDDTTADNVSKRMKTFQKATGKVVELFASKQKLATINADQDMDAVSVLLEGTLPDSLKAREHV